MSAPRVTVSVFEYLDYRMYLRAVYEARKRSSRAFSYRFFARQAGMRSPNFLKLVIDGKRNLGPESVERFAEALGLELEEKEFFADLVAFNQATTVETRNRHWARISASRRFRGAKRIDGELFEYLSHWYLPAIRELAAHPRFEADPRWVAQHLRPQIGLREAKAGLDVLVRLGLLVPGPDGRLVRGEPTLTTGHELRSLALANYHRQMLRRAEDCIDNTPSDQRDVSGVTLNLTAAKIAEIKDRIHRFRESLIDLCESDAPGDRVYQLCVQFFPLTEPMEEP